ncbi:MAG: ferredoxin family protein [Phycisphaerales bacterium]
MTHVIAEPCVNTKDASCVEVCPVDCIHPTKDEPAFETEPMLYIDPDVCIDCGLCIDECPVAAIYTEDELPEEWRRFIERNRAYYDRPGGA